MKCNKFSISCLAAVVALAGVFTASCSNGQDAAGEQQAPALQVMTVAQGSSTLYQSYPATIKGKTDIEVRPQVSGNITAVHVEEGQRVSQGQTLFTIDQVPFQAAVDQAQAAVAAAETAVANAKINADNQRALYERNIISQNAWQTADNSLRQAEASLAQCRANLTSALNSLSYTIVKAPTSGVVGTIPFRVGSLASPSMVTPLTTVSDNSQVYAYISLTQEDMLRMTDSGNRSLEAALAAIPEVKLQLSDGSEYPYTGKVHTISGVVDNTTGSASVRVLFNNPNGFLHSGYTGKVLLPVSVENAIIIPQKATFETQDLRYVFTLDDENKTVPTQITIQALNDGKNFVVTSGLNVGDRIVIEGIGTSVRAGMVIDPVDTAAE